MRDKQVLLLLTDRWADWEAAYAVSVINETPGFAVKTIAVDLLPKASIGGLRTEIDLRLEDCGSFDDVALVILPGGYSWGEEQYPQIADFIRGAAAQNVPIAAICGATLFLGKHGFLDTIRHTGDEWEYFNEKLGTDGGYKGQANFVPAQVVVDHGFITANETAALEFSLEIFRMLGIDTAEEMDSWYDKFKHGMMR